MSYIGFNQSASDHYGFEKATSSEVPGRPQTDDWVQDAVDPMIERRVSPSLTQYSGAYPSQYSASALPGVHQGSPWLFPQAAQEPLPRWPDSANTSQHSSPIDVSVLNVAPWMSNAASTAQPPPSPVFDGFYSGAVDDFANVPTHDSAVDEAGASIQYPDGTVPDEAYQISAAGTSANGGRFGATPVPLQYPPAPAFDGTFETPAISDSPTGSHRPAVTASKRKRHQQQNEESDPAAKRYQRAAETPKIKSQPRLKPLLDNEVKFVTRADKLARTKKAGTEKRKNVVEKERRDNGTHNLNKVYSIAARIRDKYQPPEGITGNAVEVTFMALIDDRDAEAARANDATAAIVGLKEENARLADQREVSKAEIQRLRAELNAVRDQAGGRTRTAHGELQGHDGLQAQFAA